LRQRHTSPTWHAGFRFNPDTVRHAPHHPLLRLPTRTLLARYRLVWLTPYTPQFTYRCRVLQFRSPLACGCYRATPVDPAFRTRFAVRVLPVLSGTGLPRFRTYAFAERHSVLLGQFALLYRVATYVAPFTPTDTTPSTPGTACLVRALPHLPRSVQSVVTRSLRV